MNRRGFLGFIGAALAGATLDPERLLWEPGKKIISIPTVSLGDFETMYLRPTAVAMANAMDLDILNWVTAESLRILHNNIAFPRVINAEYDAEFRRPIGETL